LKCHCRLGCAHRHDERRLMRHCVTAQALGGLLID
jgi:hypothetical protein